MRDKTSKVGDHKLISASEGGMPEKEKVNLMRMMVLGLFSNL